MVQREPSEVLRPKTIENPAVTELRAQMEELRTANALLTDQLADARKENAALRADLRDTRSDLDSAMRELNRRDDSSGPYGSDFVG